MLLNILHWLMSFAGCFCHTCRKSEIQNISFYIHFFYFKVAGSLVVVVCFTNKGSIFLIIRFKMARYTFHYSHCYIFHSHCYYCSVWIQVCMKRIFLLQNVTWDDRVHFTFQCSFVIRLELSCKMTSVY